VRNIIEGNDPARMRLINCGVKAFTRQSKEGGRATDPDTALVNAPGARGTDQGDMIDEDGMPPVADEKDLVFRFVYEGVEAVLPYVDPAFILVAGLKELRRMLEVYYPQLSDFEDSFAEQIGLTSMSIHPFLQLSGSTTRH
jgi:multisite-specific tRNA:(cytosine-C5)-methyltransferase